MQEIEADRFDPTPKIRNSKLNILPPNPESGTGRFPSWLHRKLPTGPELAATRQVLQGNRLHTVCEEAKCPNLLECWSKKTATFLVMGKECTRSCGFCDIDFSKKPKPLEEDESQRVIDSVKQLGLKHVVITMVARDDLPDGGAAHLAQMVQALRKELPHITIELLTSDFNGNQDAWKTVLESKPEIFNHNIETVRAMTPRVRHTATYDRTLSLLAFAAENKKTPSMRVKSGLMIGLGETESEVLRTLEDLKAHRCDVVTIGQYLQPNRHKLRVKEFIPPEQFKKYEEYGLKIGIEYMHCGPFIRSSYNADIVIEKLI